MKKLILVFLSLLLVQVMGAQAIRVSGAVTDAADGSFLPGVNVVELGTTNGTITDMNGNYNISVPGNATLIFSYVGYLAQEIAVAGQTSINVTMQLDVVAIAEVVTIGYGTVRKQDATGSVVTVSSDDFNRGAITSPQELVAGKIPGVLITNDGGQPGAGATIRIRGGSSLSASNDPLIVIDGVPVDNDGIAGMSSPLSTVNPNDIASFTVLKDASATAIYGARASNGVIIIETKKGKKNQPFTVTYDGYLSLSTRTGEQNVLSADQFREMVNDKLADNATALSLLGTENTNWQDEIFRTGIGHDHLLSFRGGLKAVPYRASVGYSDVNGLLINSNMKRMTSSVNLSPTFFDDHLKVNLNVKGLYIKNHFVDQGAVGSAKSFDPTQPVKDPNSPYGGFFTWTQDHTSTGLPIALAPRNPLAMLEMPTNTSDVYRILGNLEFDYKLHFLPDLKAHLNLGYDNSTSNGIYYTPDNAGWEYDAVIGGGIDGVYTQDKKNELLDFYLNYVKDIDAIDSRIDATAGYSWQHFWRQGTTYETNVAETVINYDTDYKTESYIISFFGRLNYVLKDKYMLTATLRQDGSSKFSPDTRWGLFPSVALAWNIANERFIPDFLNTLKLRLGYGITGQQNIMDNDYPYLPRYTYGQENAQYLFGNAFVTTIRPEGYDANIKWEETTTWNAGLDYGFLNNRVLGAVDIYYRATSDMINFIPVPAGTNLTNYIYTNVGDLTNKGVEFSINANVVSKLNMQWVLGFNATYNQNEITRLTAIDDPNYLGVRTGNISGAVGNTIQMHSVGYPTASFFAWEQVYQPDGTPIQDLYVDRNGDGLVNENDKYHYKKPAPDVFMGFSSYYRYKDFDFTFAGRINLGNYVYNNMKSTSGTYSDLYNPSEFLNNLTTDIYDSKFQSPCYNSDYYIENGSFLRMDNISVGYNFKEIIKFITNLRVYATCQNAFIITRYKGLDPEVANGIDNSLYPRPRNFQFGVSVQF
jgi:TonB-linked SusC/RagA family outer membrane protein